MPEGPHYQLRMFLGTQQVGASAVAVTPDGQNYPSIGQTIDEKWEVTAVLACPAGEFWVRVVPVSLQR